MEKMAEDKTLRRALVVPLRPWRSIRNSLINTNRLIMRGPFGVQRIEFEGDPDVPMISHEDFCDREFAIIH